MRTSTETSVQPRLEKLLNSLVNVISGYCDSPEPYIMVTTSPTTSRSPSPTKPSTPIPTECLRRETSSYESLSELIDSTEPSEDKTDRRNLMRYLLYSVNSLRSKTQSPYVFNEDELNEVKQDLMALFQNLQRLVHLTADQTIQIRYKGTEDSLAGCGTWFSVTKKLIEVHLFRALSLSINASEADIKQFIEDTLNEQQAPLLRKEISRLREVIQDRDKLRWNELLSKFDDNDSECEDTPERTRRASVGAPTIGGTKINLFPSKWGMWGKTKLAISPVNASLENETPSL